MDRPSFPESSTAVRGFGPPIDVTADVGVVSVSSAKNSPAFLSHRETARAHLMFDIYR
jgi:hypothetical protein